MNLIKNIPVLDFGIVGNRGYGFPLLGHLVESFESPYQTDADCELIREENENYIIADEYYIVADEMFTGKQLKILVKCNDVVDEVKQPRLDCFLATSEDAEMPLIQPDVTEFIVPCD